jgi:phosphotransferase system HPr-like phosphotransfer protein
MQYFEQEEFKNNILKQTTICGSSNDMRFSLRSINVKSILSPKYLEATHGESIELIATGDRARDALEASARFIHESPPCFPSKD